MFSGIETKLNEIEMAFRNEASKIRDTSKFIYFCSIFDKMIKAISNFQSEVLQIETLIKSPQRNSSADGYSLQRLQEIHVCASYEPKITKR